MNVSIFLNYVKYLLFFDLIILRALLLGTEFGG